MDRKLFIVLVLAGLIGIAYVVRTRGLGRGRSRGTATEAPASTPTAKPKDSR